MTAHRGTAAAESVFRIASLTKTFTSVALTKTLLQQGIPFTTPAIDLLSDFEPDWRADRSLTVEQILGQVTGLRETVDAATAAALGDGPEALDHAARLVVRAGNDVEPGARWSYYNGNYFLAGAILARLHGASYESALTQALLKPWQLDRTGFDTPADPVTGREGSRDVTPAEYPRTRRPSGGLWSCLTDLLTLGENLLADRLLLNATRGPRTKPHDPMQYALSWALGPSGQMYINGRLPGYRTAMLLVPDKDYAGVVLTNETYALPAAAKLLSDMQMPLTRDDLAYAIDAFAA
jgi:CubicO group peptidase (beta-lactamase class C family)